jgi:hypothetical protein
LPSCCPCCRAVYDSVKLILSPDLGWLFRSLKLPTKIRFSSSRKKKLAPSLPANVPALFLAGPRSQGEFVGFSSERMRGQVSITVVSAPESQARSTIRHLFPAILSENAFGKSVYGRRDFLLPRSNFNVSAMGFPRQSAQIKSVSLALPSNHKGVIRNHGNIHVHLTETTSRRMCTHMPRMVKHLRGCRVR